MIPVPVEISNDDFNATAPMRPEAAAALHGAVPVYGNPSSVHEEGRAARALLEAARDQVAGLVGCSPNAVTFTASGTEANNAVLAGSWSALARCFSSTRSRWTSSWRRP